MGDFGRLTVEQARELAKEKLGEVFKGNDPQAARGKARGELSFSELASRYLSHVKSYKRSWCTDETVLRVHILPVLGSQFVDQLRAEPIAALVERMREKGYATGTTNRVVIVLQHLFARNNRYTWQHINYTW